MKLAEAGELSLVEKIRQKFNRRFPDVICGIGDDSAVVRPSRKNMLLTTDMMVERVHFDLAWTTPFQLGFKLISVNVSDIYAMGGSPRFALINFAAPGDAGTEMFKRVFDGIERAARIYDVAVIGGDVSSSENVVLSASMVGYASRVLTRGGARTGDGIYVSGPLGDAACGLELMKRVGRPVEIEKGKKADFGLEWRVVSPLISRHLMPRATGPEKFARRATAMLDVSDGLLMDLSRLCRESGVGAVIETQNIPISGELRRAAAHMKISAVEMAMGGGEDYRLLFTAPEGAGGDAFHIGRIGGRGLRAVDEEGRMHRLEIKGYQHFASA
ncbi:MAG: thiamine-phosphate kinase [Candidatus Sulfobium sp.]|jgi:thiamine-monophosphate kinase